MEWREVYNEGIKVRKIMFSRFRFFFGTAILPKSTNAKHLSENVDVFKFNLSAEDVEAMDRLTNGTHFCWNPERVV